MALDSKTHTYVHSNFFNFTGKAFNDFTASKQGIEFSDAVQNKKIELEYISKQLKRLTDDFLDGKTIQELVNDIKEPYKKYNKISKEILTDMNFYKVIQHQVVARYSTKDLQQLAGQADDIANYIAGDTATLNDAADAVEQALIKKISNSSLGEQKESLTKIFKKAGLKEAAINAAVDSIKGKLGGGKYGRSPLLNKIVKQLISDNYENKNKMEQNTREIIIDTFEDYFTTKVREANIAETQNSSYTEYLRKIKELLIEHIDEKFKTGGSIGNIYGIGGEGISASVFEVGNNSLEFVIIGSKRGDELFNKNFFTNNPALYNLKKSEAQFYADMRLTNKHNGKTALVQSKNYQDLLNKYLTGDKDIMQQISLLKEVSYTTLMEKIDNTSMGHFDIDELSYIIANEAWFSKYGSINGSTVSLHQNVLDAFFADIMLNYLGLMIDKNLDVIPDISVLFYYIDNKAFVPTYKVIEGLIQRLTNWESEKKIELSTHLNKTSISPKYTSAKEFYEEKRKSLEGKSLLSPKDPNAYTDPALLKVGTDQGKQILETLKIHSVNLDVDIKELLTSAYLF